MTPEQAQDIYHAACRAGYDRFAHDYKPINQRKVILEGFGAVIKAVENEVHLEYAQKVLAHAEKDANG